MAPIIDEVVETVLDLRALYAASEEARGGPPYDPRLLLRALLYGYAPGVRSSRRLERHCLEDVAFRFLAAIRQRHPDALR